jgi:uncharacterized protein YdbL (DUF1318 family)
MPPFYILRCHGRFSHHSAALPDHVAMETTMRRLLPFKILLVSLAIAACVTINVYFPAAAAEKAADQIIDTVTNRNGAEVAPAAPAPLAPASGTSPPITRTLAQQPAWYLLAADQLINVLIPAAHAQNANLDVSTPEVRALTASMQQRFTQLEKYFASGAVGLTADGMISERDASAVPLAERAVVKRLVAEDNKDRVALYAEIAKGNGHAEWEAEIRSTFARRWIERGAKPGWYYQDAGGAWQQK